MCQERSNSRQYGGAKGSHFRPEKDVWACGGEGLWSVAEEAFAPARRVWWGGARSWGPFASALVEAEAVAVHFEDVDVVG
jgi:hypothetical protein